MGAHLMVFHFEKVIEDGGKVSDVAYQRTASEAIERMQVDHEL